MTFVTVFFVESIAHLSCNKLTYVALWCNVTFTIMIGSFSQTTCTMESYRAYKTFKRRADGFYLRS